MLWLLRGVWDNPDVGAKIGGEQKVVFRLIIVFYRVCPDNLLRNKGVIREKLRREIKIDSVKGRSLDKHALPMHHGKRKNAERVKKVPRGFHLIIRIPPALTTLHILPHAQQLKAEMTGLQHAKKKLRRKPVQQEITH